MNQRRRLSAYQNRRVCNSDFLRALYYDGRVLQSLTPAAHPTSNVRRVQNTVRSLLPAFDSGAGLLLTVLLSSDLLFLLLHIVYKTRFISDPLLSLEQDGGFAEMMQYMKAYWISLLMGWLAFRNRELHYAAWSMLFLYLMADDWLQVHEQLGATLTLKYTIPNAFGLRGVDFGELVVSAAAALLLLPSVCLTFLRASPRVRTVGTRMAMILFGIVFFGVGVDVLHSMVNHIRFYGPAATIVEDLGEMIVMTIGCSYVFGEVLQYRRTGSRSSASQLV